MGEQTANQKTIMKAEAVTAIKVIVLEDKDIPTAHYMAEYWTQDGLLIGKRRATDSEINF